MNNNLISRRRFIQAAAFASTAGFTGIYPGLSYSANKTNLTVRFDRDADSLDPGFYVGGHPNNDINWCCMPALAHYGPPGGNSTWIPSPFVERIEQVDSTHIEFTLKQGLMWSNGFGELTTDDVAFSYDRMKTSEWKGDYSAFDRVDVKDRYNGTIVLNQPFSPFMNTTLASGTGVIICKAATESVGGKFTMDVPATCGPYVFTWTQGQNVILTRNPEWTGEVPYFDTITAAIVTEDETAALAYEAGELDCTKITSNTLARYRTEPPPNSSVTIAGALQYMWLGMNTEHPKLQDKMVRQAIQHAVDKNAVIQGAYAGTAEPSFGIVSPGLLGRRLESKYSYNPGRARELLNEAGIGELSLTLRTLNNQERVLASTIIQANLADIGINVTVLPLDSGPFWEMGQESKGDMWKDLEIWLMRFGSGPDPFEPFQWFVRDQIGVWNWERWSSDEFEDLHAKGIAEVDPAKRSAIYLRMQEIMEDTGAYVWLTHEPEAYVHRNDITARFAPSGEMQLAYFS